MKRRFKLGVGLIGVMARIRRWLSRSSSAAASWIACSRSNVFAQPDRAIPEDAVLDPHRDEVKARFILIPLGQVLAAASPS